jgi:hypothetical protein
VALTLTVWTSAPAWAADTRLGGHERALLRVGWHGTVVAVGTGTLTMTERVGKNPHTYAVASDAVITYDGQTCALTDVRVGDMVTVTTDTQEGTTVATTIKVRQADR